MPDADFPYHYRAYGLVFGSQVPLPFEAVAEATPDVTVTFGDVPEALEGEASGRGFWSAQPGTYLMNSAATGRAIVRNGREVVIADDSPDVVRVFLTGSVLTAVLQQRGFVTLHASAVSIDGQAVAIIGSSGAGKSTTAAALAARGHAFLADDVLALKAEANGTICAVPSFPSVALWRDACERLDLPCDSKRPRMKGVEKYLVTMEGFRADPLPLTRIVNLTRHALGDLAAMPLQPTGLLHLAMKNIHRKRAAVALGCWPAMFLTLGDVARKIPGTRIERPRHDESTREVAQAIEALVREPQPALFG